MNSTLRARIYALHGSVGFCFGLMLLIILWSGVWSMVNRSMEKWWRFDASIIIEIPAIETHINEWLSVYEQQLDTLPENFTTQLPSERTPWVTFCHEQQSCDLTIDPISHDALKILKPMDLLTQLHRHLLLDFPGRILVSLFGVSLLLISLLGIWLHRRRLKDFWQLRFTKNIQLLGSDIHRLIGLWCLPYLLFFGLTGAISGLGALGTITLSKYTHPTSPQAVFMDLMGAPIPQPKTTENWQQQPDIAAILQLDKRQNPDFIPQSLSFHYWGNTDALLEIAGIYHGVISPKTFEKHLYHLSTATLLRKYNAQDRGFWLQNYIANQPLHYGEYEWLPTWGSFWFGMHLLMGIAATILTASGIYLWISRRQKKWSGIRSHLFIGIPTGLYAGLLLASSLLFLLQTIASITGKTLDSIFLFWGVWLFSILVAGVFPLPKILFKTTFIICGLVFLLSALLHFGIVGFAGLAQTWIIDLGLIITGISFLLIHYLLMENHNA